MEDTFVLKKLDASCLDSMLEIERLCFTDPWSRESLKYMYTPDFAIGRACFDGERLVGYGSGLCLEGEGEIINLAVHPDYRRRGIGGLILDEILSEMTLKKAGYVMLEVRSSNVGAESLYESRGFCRLGTRKKYYVNPTEDAIVMRLEIPSSDSQITN